MGMANPDDCRPANPNCVRRGSRWSPSHLRMRWVAPGIHDRTGAVAASIRPWCKPPPSSSWGTNG